jgi:hypothetical protein
MDHVIHLKLNVHTSLESVNMDSSSQPVNMVETVKQETFNMDSSSQPINMVEIVKQEMLEPKQEMAPPTRYVRGSKARQPALIQHEVIDLTADDT